jgi:hypothetical protein
MMEKKHGLLTKNGNMEKFIGEWDFKSTFGGLDGEINHML